MRLRSILSRAPIFSTAIVPQPLSALLCLPSEIRLCIYHHVFSLYPNPGQYTSTVSSLLKTYRLVNEELFIPALRALEFRVVGHPRLCFTRGIRALGGYTENLRHVSISVNMANLDITGHNNPFVLSMLPLYFLDIRFTDEPMLKRGCRKELCKYHMFVSALLFCVGPTENKGQPLHMLHRSPLQRLWRSIGVASWSFTPQREHLFEVVSKMRTWEVNVSMKVAAEDIMWHAFLYFDLVREEVTAVKHGSGEHKALVFYDEPGKDPRSFLRIAKAVFED